MRARGCARAGRGRGRKREQASPSSRARACAARGSSQQLQQTQASLAASITHRQPLARQGGPLQGVRDDQVCDVCGWGVEGVREAGGQEGDRRSFPPRRPGGATSMRGTLLLLGVRPPSFASRSPYRNGVFFFQILYSSFTRRSSTSSAGGRKEWEREREGGGRVSTEREGGERRASVGRCAGRAKTKNQWRAPHTDSLAPGGVHTRHRPSLKDSQARWWPWVAPTHHRARRPCPSGWRRRRTPRIGSHTRRPRPPSSALRPAHRDSLPRPGPW